jgi:fructose-1,6-bisphosphatase/inositol monophosphatase family enzyme
LGEEFGKGADVRESYWTIDPIDGTRAFSKGLPSWGMLMSYVEHGRATMGACLYPSFDLFVGAGRGTPAYERQGLGPRVRLPGAVAVPLSRAAVSHGGSKWWLRTPEADGFRRVIDACFLERAYGDCFAYLWLFRGKFDAVIDCGVKIWDIAPFAALAGTTGRVLTDFSGRPTITGPQSVLAHPSLNREIIALLAHG